eukprot:TRINITY_DN16153_c0_g1_i2.p1 TRINITY_DN16153_c0_g1~~TRINITY_DN16153_c0_g1_i2.p1  ORF type:complete len:101 (+),score=5.01 TRINITY_DN16153_c0_g1_i2:357-659(+)
MKSVCNGPKGCKYNSDECSVTPMSSTCGNGNLVDISKRICRGEDKPGKCAKLEGVFGDSVWDYPCGVYDGIYCNDYAPGGKKSFLENLMFCMHFVSPHDL